MRMIRTLVLVVAAVAVAVAVVSASPSLSPPSDPLLPSPSPPRVAVHVAETPLAVPVGSGSHLTQAQLARIEALSARLAKAHDAIGRGIRGSQDDADRLQALLHRMLAAHRRVAAESGALHQRAQLAAGHQTALHDGLAAVAERQKGLLDAQNHLGRIQTLLSGVLSSSSSSSSSSSLDETTTAATAADFPAEDARTAERPLDGVLRAGTHLLLPEGRFMYNHTYDLHPAPRMRLHLREGGELAGEATFVRLGGPEHVRFGGRWTEHGMRFSLTRQQGGLMRWRAHTVAGTDVLRGTWISDEQAASFLYHATVEAFGADGEAALAAEADAAERKAEADAQLAAVQHREEEERARAAREAAGHSLRAGFFVASGFVARGDSGEALPAANFYLHLAEDGSVSGAARYGDGEAAPASVVTGEWRDQALTLVETFHGARYVFTGVVAGDDRDHVSGEYVREEAGSTEAAGRGLFELHLAEAERAEVEQHAAAAAAVPAEKRAEPPADWNAPSGQRVEAEAVESIDGRVEADLKGADQAPPPPPPQPEAAPHQSAVLAEEHDLVPVTGELVPGFYLLSHGERVDAETDARTAAPDLVLTLHSDGTVSGEDASRRVSGDWSERLLQWVEQVGAEEYVFTGAVHGASSDVKGTFSYQGGSGSGTFAYRAQHVAFHHPSDEMIDRVHGRSAAVADAKPKSVTELLNSARLAAGDVTTFVGGVDRPTDAEVAARVTDKWKPPVVVPRHHQQ